MRRETFAGVFHNGFKGRGGECACSDRRATLQVGRRATTPVREWKPGAPRPPYDQSARARNVNTQTSFYKWCNVLVTSVKVSKSSRYFLVIYRV